MFKYHGFIWGFTILLALTLGQGCKQSVQVKANYKVDKKGKYIELTIRSYEFANYTLESSVASWNKSKKRHGMIGGMGRESVSLYLKDVKPGTYKVTIRVFKDTMFSQIRGKKTIDIEVPHFPKLVFEKCETTRSPVSVALVMKPEVKYPKKCVVDGAGNILMRFKASPGAKFSINGQNKTVEKTGIVRIKMSLVRWFMDIPLNAFTVPLAFYQKNYYPKRLSKPFVKHVKGTLTYKGKQLHRKLSLELYDSGLKPTARLVMRLAQKETKLPLHPNARALLYAESSTTLRTTDKTKTLGDVKYYAIRKEVGRRKIRTCRYMPIGRVPLYGLTHEVKILGGKKTISKQFKVRRASCPSSLMVKFGKKKKELFESVPIAKLRRWVLKYKR